LQFIVKPPFLFYDIFLCTTYIILIRKLNTKIITKDKTIIKKNVKNLSILFFSKEILSLNFKIKNKPTIDRNVTTALNKTVKIIEEEYL